MSLPNLLTMGERNSKGGDIRRKESKTIAYELGFENEAYFSRFFKKATGFSPREFVRRNVY
jgi:YesN/AraC family two-component response regulator